MTGVMPTTNVMKPRKRGGEKRYVSLDNQFRRWLPKSTHEGLPTPAVERRMAKLGNLDIGKAEDRKKFGYCYLEFV